MARAKSKNYIDETKKAMDSLGVYKPEYDKIINIYADLLTQYDDASQKFADSGYEYETSTAAGGTKKSATAATLESLRKDILSYSTALGLNPKSMDAMNIKPAPMKSKLDNVMELLNSG